MNPDQQFAKRVDDLFPLSEMCFTQWPSDKPRPTPEETARAQERYLATIAEGDMSDYGMGLGFVMATYSSSIWLPFFAKP